MGVLFLSSHIQEYTRLAKSKNKISCKRQDFLFHVATLKEVVRNNLYYYIVIIIIFSTNFIFNFFNVKPAFLFSDDDQILTRKQTKRLTKVFTNFMPSNFIEATNTTIITKIMKKYYLIKIYKYVIFFFGFSFVAWK